MMTAVWLTSTILTRCPDGAIGGSPGTRCGIPAADREGALMRNARATTTIRACV